MQAKVSDALFVRRQSTGSITTPPVIRAGEEEHQSVEMRPTVTTLADCLSPLLTSMKLFGLYFKRGTSDKSADDQSRGRWNLSMIHSAIVAVLLWINVIRMFSVFTDL